MNLGFHSLLHRQKHATILLKGHNFPQVTILNSGGFRDAFYMGTKLHNDLPINVSTAKDVKDFNEKLN